MNLTQSPTAAPASAPAAPAGATRREAPRGEHRGTRDAFERALNAKAQPFAAAEHESTTPEGAESDGAMPMMAWAPMPLVCASEPAPPAAAALAEPATGTRAALETALQNAEPHDVHPLAGTDRSSVWEASVGDSLSGTVEVRAERIATNGAPPSWALTVGTPTLGADVATRHAPRLHDRLRKHGIEVDHVRIERKRDRDDEPR